MGSEKQLNDKTWSQVRERDDWTCQDCKKQMYTMFDPVKEREEARIKLLSFKDFPVYRYYKECWKCKERTQILSYFFFLAYNHTIGNVEKLDLQMLEKFELIKKVHSYTMECEVIANVCEHCQALQGNWFVSDDINRILFTPDEIKETPDLPVVERLQNNLTLDDTNFETSEVHKIFTGGEVHHINKDRTNNQLSNLVFLCRKCHLKRHNKKIRTEPSTKGDS